MTEILAPHTEILPRAQQIVWPELGAIGRGFVLYGGTAIALQFGHRHSVDFDFFGTPPVDATEFMRKYSFVKSGRIIQSALNTLSVLTPTEAGEVKLSFFGDIQFGRVRSPSICKENFIRVASPLDLAVQKLIVIMKRSEAKDFIDLHCLLQNGVKLADAMGAAEAIVPGFPVAVALRAMCYFEGGDLEVLPKKLRKSLVDASARFSVPRTIRLESHELDLPEETVAEARRPSGSMSDTMKSHATITATLGGRAPAKKRGK